MGTLVRIQTQVCSVPHLGSLHIAALGGPSSEEPFLLCPTTSGRPCQQESVEDATMSQSWMETSVVMGKVKTLWCGEGISRRRGVGWSCHEAGGKGSRSLWALECFQEAGWEPGGSWPLGRRECLCGRPACSVPAILAEVHLEPMAGQRLHYSSCLRS